MIARSLPLDANLILLDGRQLFCTVNLPRATQTWRLTGCDVCIKINLLHAWRCCKCLANHKSHSRGDKPSSWSAGAWQLCEVSWIGATLHLLTSTTSTCRIRAADLLFLFQFYILCTPPRDTNVRSTFLSLPISLLPSPS